MNYLPLLIDTIIINIYRMFSDLSRDVLEIYNVPDGRENCQSAPKHIRIQSNLYNYYSLLIYSFDIKDFIFSEGLYQRKMDVGGLRTGYSLYIGWEYLYTNIYRKKQIAHSGRKKIYCIFKGIIKFFFFFFENKPLKLK